MWQGGGQVGARCPAGRHRLDTPVAGLDWRQGLWERNGSDLGWWAGVAAGLSLMLRWPESGDAFAVLAGGP